MISGEIVAGLEPLVDAWRGCGIQVMVLLSFAVQVTLLCLADIRRFNGSAIVKAIIWSAYVLADTTAIYALGHMSVVSNSAENQLMALWASLLLVHLGGQDNITAYAIDDNRLWLRHLQTLGVQVMAAAYVIYESSILDSRTEIRAGSILMFVVGVIKYGERALALLCANNCASSSLSATSYKDLTSKHKKPYTLTESNSATSSVRQRVVVTSMPPIQPVDTLQDLVLIAYTLLDAPKQMFEGPTRYVEIGNASYSLEADEMLVVVTTQLEMMYDLLYTKASVVYTWHGWCIRVFSLPATVAALLLFHASGSKDGYRRLDVVATYVLLGGAAIVETTSAARAMCSVWTCAHLQKGKFVRLARLLHCQLGGLVSWGMVIIGIRTSNHRGYMGQHSLFQLCAGSRNNASSKLARWIGRGDRWDSMFYSWSTPVSEDIVDLMVRLVSAGQDITDSRGRNVLIGHRDDLELAIQDFEWSVELDLDESFLVWHIATHVYLTWLREHKVYTSRGRDQLAEEISNYMFFLLAARPYMLPYPVSRQNYIQLCYDVITSGEDLLRSLPDQVRAWATTDQQSQGEFEMVYPSGSPRNETLDRGCQLAVKLISAGKKASMSSIMEMICEVWVEILCHTAYWCNENCHAKHLSDGGEIMTTFALHMLYNSKGLINKSEMDKDNV